MIVWHSTDRYRKDDLRFMLPCEVEIEARECITKIIRKGEKTLAFLGLND